MFSKACNLSSSSSDSDEFQEEIRHISKKARSSREDSDRNKSKHKSKKVEKSSRPIESSKSDKYSEDKHSKHHQEKYDNKKDSKEKQSSSKRKRGEDSDKKYKLKERESKNNERESKHSDHRENRSDSKGSENSNREKEKLFAPDRTTDGIDSASGASFADALGMCATLPVSKKKSSVAKPKASSSNAKFLSSKDKGEKPVLRRTVADDEALSRVIRSKNQRTKVYSGNKVQWNKVPTLYELCVRKLQDNIDSIEYTGGVPYSVLKPILEKGNPDQLYMIEHDNPYLVEDTEELWQLHCQREFKTKCRKEMETWREMYIRCLDEREAKLKALTANIKMSQDKSLPVRTTKLAYVDSIVKPPNPGVKVEESSRSSSSIKPVRKAPLMQKTLSSMKNRFKR